MVGRCWSAALAKLEWLQQCSHWSSLLADCPEGNHWRHQKLKYDNLSFRRKHQLCCELFCFLAGLKVLSLLARSCQCICYPNHHLLHRKIFSGHIVSTGLSNPWNNNINNYLTMYKHTVTSASVACKIKEIAKSLWFLQCITVTSAEFFRRSTSQVTAWTPFYTCHQILWGT